MVASITNASIRWHYSTQRPGGWPAAMLAKLGLEALLQKWPQEVLPLGAVVGGLTAAAAAERQRLWQRRSFLVGDILVGMVGGRGDSRRTGSREEKPQKNSL